MAEYLLKNKAPVLYYVRKLAKGPLFFFPADIEL